MRRFFGFVMLLFVAFSCRTEQEVIPSTDSQITQPYANLGDTQGFFVLNEGNMGSNKATIDFFDYATGRYSKNIYAERNPSVVKELGDVGNDLQIHDGRLYAVVNCSNLVEVMDLATATHIGSFSVPNCRYITFDDAYAYVSSYVGAVQVGGDARLGYVAKVDLKRLKVVAECGVGYQPEEMAIVSNKLYVANSGGYMVPNYDNTISVIDLDSFEEVKKIEVAINLYHMEVDNYGYLWVSSRGDHGSVLSNTYIVDCASDAVVGALGLPNSNMAIAGDRLYVANSEGVSVVDVKNQKIIEKNFIKDNSFAQLRKPYGIAYCEEYDELLVTDADDYITPGKIYCYGANGLLRWSVPQTGDIPSVITFTKTKLENIR